MSLRKNLLAAAVAGAMVLPGAANAVITIDGITFDTGAIFETIDLFEAEAFGDGFGNDNGLIDQQGERLVGVGIVNRIRKNDPGAGNPVLWENGDNGKILTIFFNNYVAENLNAVGNELFIGFTGGQISLYSQNDPNNANYIPQATQAAGIANATAGNLWLSLMGSPIGVEATPSGSTLGVVSGAPITLLSTGPLAGTAGALGGVGNLDVTGGLAGAFFDTDTFNCVEGNPLACNNPPTTDKRFTSSGQVGASPAGNAWAFFGTGEVQNFAQQRVPEPGTLGLIGLALAGLAAFSRRRVES